MSGALGAAALGIGTSLVSAIIAPKRKIGSIIPGIVLEESHRDSLVVTSHPVQVGSNINDHAYFNPPDLSIRASWSNADLGAITDLFTGGSILGVLTDGAFGSQSYAAQKYQEVLQLYYSITPVEVITGKRVYQNMLITNVSEVTTKNTEYCLVLDIGLRYINIVTVQTTKLPPATQQANPQQTDTKQNTGTQAAQPVDSPSALRQAGNALGITTPTGDSIAPGAAISSLGSKLMGALIPGAK